MAVNGRTTLALAGRGPWRRTLGPGDSAFIEADTVHASFNTADKPAKLIVVLGPCVGDEGYELVDVSDELPWKTLR